MRTDRYPAPGVPAFYRSLCLLCAVGLGAPCAHAVEVHYHYDALGRLTGVTLGEGSTLAYNHDGAGNRTRFSTTRAAVGPDTDGDGIPDALDLCALVFDPQQRDNDGNGIGDQCDDHDHDGVPDALDAFPHDPSEWADHDGDGIGDNADTDDDNDGVLDAAPDNCPFIPNPDQHDSNGNRIGDACEPPDFCWACLPSRGGWRAILDQ